MTKTTIVLAALGFMLLAGASTTGWAADPRYPGAPGPGAPGETERRAGPGADQPDAPGGSAARKNCLIWTGNDLTCNHYYDQCTGAQWKNCAGVWTQK